MLKSEQVWEVLCRGSSAKIAHDSVAKFQIGEKVIAKILSPPGHIRLPEYVQGHQGTVIADRGAFIFPDASAQGIRVPQRLYTVQFKSRDLWNHADFNFSDSVLADLFESYLDKA